MASKQVQSAWRQRYKARKQGRPVPDEASRIINEYQRPQAREYKRRVRDALRHIPAHLFYALKDRGISAKHINRHIKLKPRARYLLVGTAVKNGTKTFCIMHFNKQIPVIKALSEAPFGAILIDTKEIR